MNRLPDIEAVIDRRMLVNFRVDPDVAARVVPPPFRVNVTKGVALAGICLIRLTELRPHGFPRAAGITTESGAHRFAVTWETGDPSEPGHGVYIPRRDTDSRLTVLFGGRLFPGEHHRARFDVREAGDLCAVDLTSADGTTRVSVRARKSAALPSGSVFRDVDDASAFFGCDSLGYSKTREPGAFDGMELQPAEWHLDPLTVEHVESSFFDDRATFPAGSVEFDSALLMRRTPARWESRPRLQFSASTRVA